MGLDWKNERKENRSESLVHISDLAVNFAAGWAMNSQRYKEYLYNKIEKDKKARVLAKKVFMRINDEKGLEIMKKIEKREKEKEEEKKLRE